MTETERTEFARMEAELARLRLLADRVTLLELEVAELSRVIDLRSA